MSQNEVLSAVRRTEQVYWEQICEWESLEYGVAFSCPRYPDLAGAQQLRDVWLAELDGPAAFDRAEQYYADRNLTCAVWSPASGQATEPVEAVMNVKGWRREDIVALSLADIDKGPGELELEGHRVLPARAMRRAYLAYLESRHPGRQQECDAAFDRLDDANYELLLAVRSGDVVGAIAYHEVGEVARLREFSRSSDADESAVRRLLMAHFLLRARRLSPRAVVAGCSESAPQEIQFLEECGFAQAGKLPQFHRPE